MGIEVAGRWTSSGLGKVKSPKKHKRAMGRYLLNAANEYRKAKKRQEGSTGAASPIRQIVKDGKPV